MEAAFVDIGLERNGFLHVDEIVLPGRRAGAASAAAASGRRIDELIKPGQEILVQVVKDPLKTKGARLSMNVSIAGRYLVYAPQGERRRASAAGCPTPSATGLRKMVDRTYKGPGGLIVRTAAHGAKKADFVREIDYLQKLNEVLERRAEEVKAPDLVFQEADLSIRVLRDVFLNEFEAAIIDIPKQLERVTSFFQRTAPELVDGVELYKGTKPLFERDGGRRGDRVDALAARRPALGRLPDDRLRRGADRDRRQHAAASPAAARAGSRRRSPGSTSRRPRRSCASCACATSAGSSSSTSSTWRGRSNRDKVLKTLRKALDADKSKSYVVEVSPLGPGRDDAPERHRRGARDPHRALPDLRGRGRRPLGRDGGDRGAAQAARDRRRASRDAGGVPGPGQPEGRGAS